MPAAGTAPSASPLRVEPAGVMATAFKPSDDGKALIVRLFGASGKAQTATLTWRTAPKQVWLSDASEKPLKPAAAKLKSPPGGW